MSSAHAQLFGVWASTDHSRFHLFIYLDIKGHAIMSVWRGDVCAGRTHGSERFGTIHKDTRTIMET